MVDKSFRASRTREPIVEADPATWPASDPLAELARLIGQTDLAGEIGRSARNTTMDPADGRAATVPGHWPADETYAEPEPYAENVDVQPRFAEAYPGNHAYSPQSRDDRYDGSARAQHAAPASQFEDPPFDAVEGDRYSDEGQLPALAPQPDEAAYETEQQWHDGGDDQSYAAEDYQDEAPSVFRRGGAIVALAVLGLAILGVAGAFGYRTMFGGKLLPSLPPIIKASDTPNRIMPAHTTSQADASNQPDGGAKLVSREEQPLTMQTPPSGGPRVISTIPILPAAGAAGQGGPLAPPSAAAVSAPTSAPAPIAAPLAPASTAAIPSATSATAGPAATATSAPATPVASTTPRKIHTVIIREMPPGGTQLATASAALPLGTTTQTSTVPHRSVRRLATAQPANAPLALVPGQNQPLPPPAVSPARTRVARAEAPDGPLALEPGAAAPLARGYSVQVTSQRSEQAAREAFRSLQARFPAQLNRREAMIRRANLGAKGTFYRALVGPFASVEEAATMCGQLKSAGGTCLVERN